MTLRYFEYSSTTSCSCAATGMEAMSAFRTPLYLQVADVCFDTEGLSSADAASALARLLEGRWQRGAVAA